MSSLEGAVIGGYLLQSCLGKGGVADVYRAQRPGQEGEEVVIKVFRHGYAQRPAFRSYFLSEAEKIGKLKHPHILPFLEYGQRKELLYVIMPYIVSGNLEDLLARVGGRLSAMQALPVVEQLCSALTYIHERQTIHGNMKPQNILVASDGQMLLSDFGIMHSFDDSQQSLTRIGWGSAEYASPEQSLGIQRYASDIYALGVILFRMLAGVPPFTGQTPVEVLLKHVREPVPSVRSLVPTIAETVDSVLNRALQKRADERYRSAKELYEALQAAIILAPIASPVVRIVTREQARSPEAPLKKLPLKKLSLQGADPTTPIPISLALDEWQGQRSGEAWWQTEGNVANVLEQEKTLPTNVLEQEKKLPVREPGQEKKLPMDSEHQIPPWVASEPPEWSPLAREGEPREVPLTVAGYLQQMEAVDEARFVVGGQMTGEQESETNVMSSAGQIQRWLPVIVVVLLLLGLCGALLSAVFLG
ncbi:MAG TPA: serine/threonine-protein kinase [Ktedonobacteraceae bacterium]|jgi:serine/threonine protein kinase|nr:serine/threonine-protein kinase [Ktedonobacteraceae bacterium]